MHDARSACWSQRTPSIKLFLNVFSKLVGCGRYALATAIISTLIFIRIGAVLLL